MSGRLARRVLSATLALVAGLLLVPALPAAAVDEPLPVRVEITSISPVVLRPGELPMIKTLAIAHPFKQGTFTFPLDAAPVSVVLDPNTTLLMDAGPFLKR